jgi:hypothetical protein
MYSPTQCHLCSVGPEGRQDQWHNTHHETSSVLYLGRSTKAEIWLMGLRRPTTAACQRLAELECGAC